MKKTIRTPKRRNGKRAYHQGYYTIKNPDKYKGDLSNVRYLSSWEHKFFIYLDHNIAIHKWSAESLVIPYQDEKGKLHRYLPDIYIEKLNKHDKELIDKWVIEIKPYNEVNPKFVDKYGGIIPPEIYLKKTTPTALESYEYQLKTYQKNLYKWTKAKTWCENNGMNFKIAHEKYLKSIGVL